MLHRVLGVITPPSDPLLVPIDASHRFPSSVYHSTWSPMFRCAQSEPTGLDIARTIFCPPVSFSAAILASCISCSLSRRYPRYTIPSGSSVLSTSFVGGKNGNEDWVPVTNWKGINPYKVIVPFLPAMHASMTSLGVLPCLSRVATCLGVDLARVAEAFNPYKSIPELKFPAQKVGLALVMALRGDFKDSQWLPLHKIGIGVPLIGFIAIRRSGPHLFSIEPRLQCA